MLPTFDENVPQIGQAIERVTVRRVIRQVFLPPGFVCSAWSLCSMSGKSQGPAVRAPLALDKRE
jgi:hypothetical protein